MTDEQRLRDAFADVQRRVAMIPAPTSPAAAPRPGWQAPGPLAALAAVVLVAVIGVGLLLRGGDDTTEVATEPDPTSTVPATTASTDDGSPVTTDAPLVDDGSAGAPLNTDAPTTETPPADEPAADIMASADGARFRVDSAAVAADTGDPFLNVRRAPDVRTDIVAKLPPTYRGLRAIGGVDIADDGGEWIEVELVHPTPILATLEFGEAPTGWVNSAFLLPLASDVSVGADEVAPCSDVVDELSGGSPMAFVRFLESGEVAPGCRRVVIGLGEESAPFEWVGVSDVVEASAPVRVDRTGGLGVRIDLGVVVDSAWPRATETADGVYLVRGTDNGLDLVLPAGGNVRGVRSLSDSPGVVIIDIDDVSVTAPPANRNIALTRDPIVGDGYVDLVGIARPFEATLGVAVEDSDGQPVTAVFSGSSFLGTVEATEYGVSTTDWLEAWGEFAVRIVVPAGDYTVVLDGDGSSDEPEVLRVPVTINGEQTWGASEALIDLTESFAQAVRTDTLTGPLPPGSFPLANGVTLLLGDQVVRTESAEALGAIPNWQLDVADFAGFSGPFNAAEVLAANPAAALSVGPIDACASPPRDWPAELDGLVQVNLTPIGIDSCIEWFAVNVFFDDDGRIAAVALDLFGP